MAVVYDPPRETQQYGLCTHLISTKTPPASTEELKEAAGELGLPPFFIQNEGEPKEHFDVYGGALRRLEAHHNFQEVSFTALATYISDKRSALDEGSPVESEV